MSEWKKVKLGELYEVHNGLSKGRQFFGSGYPFLTFSDVFNNWFLPETLDSLVQSSDKEREACSIKKCDVFITRTSETMDELGMSSVALKDYPDATYNGFTKRLRPITDEVVPEYIGYYLRSKKFRAKFMAFSSMTTRASLANDDLLGMEVEIPDKTIQHRIATILSRYDTLIENYQKQIKLLEEAAQRLYKEWFVELRFPGHENTKMVDGLPEGWERKKLGELTSKFATGLNPRKNFVLGRGNNYYVTIKNMSNNDVAFDEKCDKVDDEALEKINKRSDLQMGDLLFSGIGTIGRVYLIDKPVTNWNISESVFTMRPKPNIPSSFLYLVLLDKEIQDYCHSNAHGCAQKGIRMADLKAFEVLVPSQSVLYAFNNVTSNLIKQVKYKSSQIRLLTEARDRLLPRLMGGEMEVDAPKGQRAINPVHRSGYNPQTNHALKGQKN